MDPLGRRSEDALRWLALAAIVAAGAFLRFDGLSAPSYWLDEVLDGIFARDALNHPWWHWLTGFGREHGPLHFAIQLLAPNRLPAAIAGVATIVLLAVGVPCRGAAEVGGARPHGAVPRGAALVAALLLASSPFHVYYSREARPYALLMLLAVALLIAILREKGTAIAILSLIALYTSAIAAAMVGAAVIAAFLVRRRMAIPAACVAVLFPLLYRADPAGTGASTAHIDWAELARAFTVSGLGLDQRGHTMLAMLAFGAIGAIAMFLRDRRLAMVVLTMTLVPIAVVVAMVIVRHHFFALRYVAPALPPFLLLVANGIITLARREVIAIPVAIVIAMQTWPAARVEPFRKLDWRGIAKTLEEHARPGDVILTADQPSDVVLRHYLRNLKPGVRVANVPYVDVAKVVVASAPAVWIVTTYNAPDLSVRQWACEFPLLFASSLEGFRLHYAPDAKHFLRSRALAAELHAFAENLVLRAGENDDLFLGDGWTAADVVAGRSYRWATATRATLLIPRGAARDRTVSFLALGVARQTMHVKINGTAVGEAAMSEGWQTYSFGAPARVWRDGMNEVTLEFARTAFAPNDPRPLAALFDTIALGAGSNPSFLPPLRMPGDRFLDANALWRGESRPSFPRERLQREKIEPLLSRLGFDPDATWRALADGRVELNDVVRSAAWGPDCVDDETFLERAFATLLERGPNPIERRDLLGRMARGVSRDDIVARIIRAGEFRKAMLRE